MTTLLSADEIIKQSAVRTWYQLGTGGTRYFYGTPGYQFISGATKQIRGGVSPVYAPDPRRPGRYRLISRTLEAPDLDEFSVDFHEGWGGIPRHLLQNQCDWTFYELRSRCGDPSDWARGWDSIMVYARGLYDGGIDLGTRTARDSDDPLTDSATFKAAAIYPVGALNFGEEAATQVVVEVIDVVYGTAVSCGNCGTENDGSQHIYALTRANVGSPSAPGQIVYSLDGGITWSTATITGIGATNEPQYLELAGNILFVGMATGTSLYYTTLTSTGAPGTWTSTTLAGQSNDVYVQSPSAVWFVRAGGNIDRSTDIPSGSSNVATVGTDALQRVHGYGNTIVAVGANGQVVYSANNGVTWTDGANAGSATNQALAVVSDRIWYVGDASGGLWRTTDGGVSYSTISLPGPAPSAINDIVFATPEVGWISATVSSTARLYATFDGGFSWSRDDGTSRIASWPTFQRARRIATPMPSGDPGIAANYLAVGGLTTAGTDGILLVGAPALV